MPVQLLPFQKLVDIPDVAQRHRCAIRGLAITSIVLICTIACLFVSTLISAGATLPGSKTLLFLIFIGIPSMILLFFVTCIPSVISRHNTDKWVSTDRCCNLMRSHPACCTRCCSGSKHCCARLSSMHIGASVLASVICVLFVVVLISGCSEFEYEKKMRTTTRSYWETTTTRPDWDRSYESCNWTAGFETTAILLLLSLVATTARSAYLLRQIEQSMPELEVLPPGKMVTQYDQLVTFVSEPVDTGIWTGNDTEKDVAKVEAHVQSC